MTKICTFKTAKHRKGRSFDSAECFFSEGILSYGEEKNASMGRKSDLYGVFSSNHFTLTRHIWKDCEELADDARYTEKYQKLYKQRKEKMERVFADAKEKHGMRYTHYMGLAQVTNWVRLKFAAMNLKKLAVWKWKRTHHKHNYSVVFTISPTFFPKYQKPCIA